MSECTPSYGRRVLAAASTHSQTVERFTTGAWFLRNVSLAIHIWLHTIQQGSGELGSFSHPTHSFSDTGIVFYGPVVLNVFLYEGFVSETSNGIHPETESRKQSNSEHGHLHPFSLRHHQ